MNSLRSLNSGDQDFQHPDLEQKRRPLVLIAVAVSLLTAAILAIGYFFIFYPTAQNPVEEQNAKSAVPTVATEAQIFEDEPVLKDSQVVISGKVRNISRESLNDLSLELELKRRSDSSLEVRSIEIEPNDLAPGGEGKYALVLPRKEFSGTQIKHLKSAARSTLIAFKTAPGTPRPKELPPEPPTRTVIIQRPSPRSKGEEFINTPDTPTRVP